MKKNYFLIMITVGFFSCQKEISNEVSHTNTSAQVDVYVAGFVSDDSYHRHDYTIPSYPLFPSSGEYPSYWKNGNLVKLDGDLPNLDGEGYVGGMALSIAVSGNDVYVSGSGLANGPYRQAIAGLFWKNGVRDNYLSQSSVPSLKVSNNDLYLVGFSLGIFVPGYSAPATYYKNGDPVLIVDGSAGSATSIAVSGNDVYVAGVSIRNQKLIAKYWKNGNPVNLTDGSNSANTWSIAVSGTDVYVAGTEWNGNSYQDGSGNTSRYGIAKYWKNGQATALTDGTSPALATSIAVVGSDVYVSGIEDGVAKYWKNGIPMKLTDGSKWAEARSIAVSGNDVYVAGFEDGVAKYWKNGTAVILGDASKYSEAYSIFLVKK